MTSPPATEIAATPARSRRHGLPVAAAIVVWFALILIAYLWGRRLPGEQLHLGNIPPLFSGIRDHPLIWQLLPAAAVALAIAVWLPRLAETLTWRKLLPLSWFASTLWVVSLNASDGWHRLANTLTTRYEYLPAVPRVGSVHEFLSTFVARIPTYPTHVKGHGPLALLPFWALAKLGLPQSGWAAALVIGVGTSAAMAVAITVRATIGEKAARTALPFLVLLPAAIWIATSADAMFLGISAWGVAVLAIATTLGGRRAAAVAFGAGILFGAALYMSYGLLVLIPLPLVVLAMRRRIGLLVPVVAGLLIVAGAFTLEGFWYLDGYHATQAAWSHGVGPHRSRPYFLEANVADLALATGPVAAIALAKLRDRRIWLLVGSVIVAIVASDLSGYVRAETERIWLPFMPWLLVAAADLRLTRRQTTVALAVQALTALLIQGYTHSAW